MSLGTTLDTRIRPFHIDVPDEELAEHEVDRGGHFAAWEQPELFGAEVRAALRSLR